MSRLADLINELCPDGVEYKPLDEVAELKRGQSITKKSITPGDIPVIAGGRKPAYFTSSANRTGMTIVVAGSGAYAGFVSYWDQPIFVSDAFSVKVNEEILVPRFTYHWMCGKQKELYSLKSGGGVPHVYPKDVAKFKCPIPPLEVQCEIVRILDQFTTLEAELEAELEARQAQYEYYRNQLLSYDALASRGPVKWVKLGDIGTVKMCKRNHKKETADKGDVPFNKISSFGGAPTAFISRNQFMEYKSKYPYPKVGDLLISASGTIGRVVRFNCEDAYFQDSNIVWLDHDESIVSNRFLFYLYKVISWETEGGTIKRLYNSRILKQEIPVPSFCEQQRIADILDRFDALVNDISSGLPAEIAARRAQYEYYRDRLLSFSEKK